MEPEPEKGVPENVSVKQTEKRIDNDRRRC
jgi:hypothetical protein